MKLCLRMQMLVIFVTAIVLSTDTTRILLLLYVNIVSILLPTHKKNDRPLAIPHGGAV